MKTPESISYSNGAIVQCPVVQIWDDLNNERGGYKRAFWCASPDADTGSPVIGYCSPGGSQPTCIGAAREVWRLYPDAMIYSNGRAIVRSNKP